MNIEEQKVEESINYDNHFKNVLTKEQWDAFLKAQDNNKDTSEFMPSGHWTDLLEKQPAKTRVKN